MAADEEEQVIFSPVGPVDLDPGGLASEAWQAGWRAAAYQHSAELEAAVNTATLEATKDMERRLSNAEHSGYRRAEEYVLSELRAADTDDKKRRDLIKRLEERCR